VGPSGISSRRENHVHERNQHAVIVTGHESREAYERESGVEERVDTEPPELPYENPVLETTS